MEPFVELKWWFGLNMGLLLVFALQSELVDLAESIQQKLSYFNELENINTVGASHLSAASSLVIEWLY